MSKKSKLKIINYKFEDHKKGVRAVFIGNFILAMIFGVINPFSLICLISAAFILVFYLAHDWKNSTINFLIPVVYVSISCFEFVQFGIPPALIKVSDISGKGAFFGMILLNIPNIYCGIRLLLVIPLIQIFFTSRRLEKLNQSISFD